MPSSPSRLLTALYLVWCVGVSGFALSSVAHIVDRYLAVRYGFWLESFFVVAQVGFQWMFMPTSPWKLRQQYAVVALSVSMAGSLMLLPLLAFHRWHGAQPVFALAYFFAIVLVIFGIHHREIRRGGYPAHLTWTWLLYRTLLLVFLITPRSG